MNSTTKPWYASKSIWGSLIAIGSALASVFGIDVTAEDQATLMSALLQLSTIGGSLFAIFGRLVAKTEIE